MVQRLGVWQCLAVAGLCALVFSPALTGGFLLWDDQHHFIRNPWLIEGEWLHFWKSAYYGFYIPVTYTLWTWLYDLLPHAPAFHVFNLLLHILNCLLVARLLPLLFPELERRGIFFAVLIFAIHPLQTETVAWISGGRDLLAAAFALSAVLLLFTPRGRFATPLSVLLFTFSLLCKPQYLLLPVVLLWLAPAHRRVLLIWLSFSIAATLNAMVAQNEFVMSRLSPIEYWQRPLIALDSIGFYFLKTLWPWPLSPDYGRTPEFILSHKLFLKSTFVVAIVSLGAGWLRRKSYSLRGLGFAILLLTPVLGLISFSGQDVSTVFDRYMYLPMVGMATLYAQFVRKKFAESILGFLIVAWSLMSFQYSQVWKSDRGLATHMIQTNPRSYAGLNNLASVELGEENVDRAIELLKTARDLKPGVAVALSNLAHAYWKKGDLESILTKIKPQLSNPEFLAENATEPEGLALMYRMVGRAHFTLKHKEDAREMFCKARKINPIDPHLKNEFEAVMKELGEQCL